MQHSLTGQVSRLNIRHARTGRTSHMRPTLSSPPHSDTLMDRAVINEANLRNALLMRAVLTRSDLGGADIFGADFTNALLDKTQQIVGAAA